MLGGIEDIITSCRTYYQAEALKQQMGAPAPSSSARA
jgi:peptide chain release factor 1